MGSSGVGIFHDDVAADVRCAYLELLAGGENEAAAFRTMLSEWKDSISDSDDGPVFWLALAATQWEYGCLHPRVKKEALKVIDNGIGIDRWADAGLAKGRKAVLAKLKWKLLTLPPKRKKPKRRAVPVVPSNSMTAPDGNAEARVFQLNPKEPFSQVCITMKVKRQEGGGSVFVAHCNLTEIKLQWLDAETLQITYPKWVEVEKQEATSFFYGRTITVKYRRVGSRTPAK
jgi:hypothetical protein